MITHEQNINFTAKHILTVNALDKSRPLFMGSYLQVMCHVVAFQPMKRKGKNIE